MPRPGCLSSRRRLQTDGPVGVRLDSGDLAGLARSARRLLDEAGLPGARIFASGGLDEYAIAGLVAQQAPIDAYGVGTKMGVLCGHHYRASQAALQAAGAAVYDHEGVLIMVAAGRRQPHRHQTAAAA